MRTTYVIAAVGCILLAVIVIAGCTGTPGTSVAAGTPAVVPTPTAIENNSSFATSISTSVAAESSGVSAASYRTLYVNSTSNGGIVTVPMGERVLVRLDENPTTGYSWNATASKGLTIISDTYNAPDTTLMGAHGHHDWLLSPETVDTYTFKAVYLRPWEGVTATDETFSLVIQVTKD